MVAKQTMITGVLLALLVLTNGAQYLLTPTGQTEKCGVKWVFQDSGINEGKYFCNTTQAYNYCYKLTSSSKVCQVAVPVVQKNTGTQYLCSTTACNKIK